MQFSQGVISFFDLFYDYIVFAANPVQFLYKITVQINGKSRRQGYSFPCILKAYLRKSVAFVYFKKRLYSGNIGIVTGGKPYIQHSRLILPCFRLSCIFRSLARSGCVIAFISSLGSPSSSADTVPSKA